MASAIRKKREAAERYLVERGLSARSLPRAIAIHEALGLCMLAVTWRLAYVFPPSNIPFLKQPLARIANAVPHQLSFLSSKSGASYIEASCMRKLVRPLTIPGKLYVTFLIMSNFEENTADMAGKDGKTAFLPKAAFLQPLPTLHSLI